MKLTLVRGIPGSGKSTFAKAQLKMGESTMFEADEFQTNPLTGDYEYRSDLHTYAHMWCLSQTAHRLKYGLDVYVANTFVEFWAIEKYLELAKKIGCEVEIIHVKGKFESIHDVPEDVMERMEDKFMTNREIYDSDRFEAWTDVNICFREYDPTTEQYTNKMTYFKRG